MQNGIKQLFLFFWLFSISLSAIGQDAVIKFGASETSSGVVFSLTGQVTDAESAQPLPSAHLHIDGLFGCATDANGKYFVQLKRGLHNVVVRHLSMAPQLIAIEIYENGVFNVAMRQKTFELEELVVQSTSTSDATERKLSAIEIGGPLLKKIPALGGEADLVRSLQLFPGVTNVGEGSAGFNVRGGRTDQNLMLMNEALVISSTHALGFSSVFNPDIVSDFTLYKGGTPASFGGRSSATLNVNTKSGDYTRWNYLSTVGSGINKIMLDGPLVREKTSLLTSLRFSTINWQIKQSENQDVQNSKVNFADLFTSVSHKFTSRHSIFLNLLGASDYFRFSQQFGYEWKSLTGSIESRNLISPQLSLTALLTAGSFNSRYFSLKPTQSYDITNGLRYQQLKSTLLYTPGSHAIAAGFELVNYNNLPERKILNSQNNQKETESVRKNSGTEGAAFINAEWALHDRIQLATGIRYSVYRQTGPDSVNIYTSGQPLSVDHLITREWKSGEELAHYGGWEPRASLSFTLAPHILLKLNYNRMFQYLHSISNTTAPTPIDSWQVSNTYIRPQRSETLSGGVTLDSKDGNWSLNSEVFFRHSVNQLDYKNFASLYVNSHLETELLPTDGKSYGFENQLKRNKGKWTGWLSYTFSRSFSRTPGTPLQPERINYGKWYPSNYDRPHNASLVLSRRIWPKGSFGFTTSFSSGRPLTILKDYYITNATLLPNYSARNDYRIPNYLRIDLSLEVKGFSRKNRDMLSFSIYNLLGRRNAYSVFFTRDANYQYFKSYRLSILGKMLPSISYSYKF